MDNFLNRSVIDEVRVNRVVHTGATNDTQAMLAVRYATGQINTVASPTTANSDNYHRLSADANGSSTSHLIVFLNIGNSATDYVQHQFSYSGVAVADPAGVATGTAITAHTCTTIGKIVEELNTVAGVDAYVLHCLTSLATNNANFIDVASTNLAHMKYSNVLYRDFSAVYATAMRVGIPEPMDSGRIKLLRISGACTGVTAGTVKLYRDDPAVGPVELLSFAMGTTTVETVYVANATNAMPVYRGPLVLVAASNDMSACDLVMHTVQAEY